VMLASLRRGTGRAGAIGKPGCLNRPG
jgi:hypothetical protein